MVFSTDQDSEDHPRDKLLLHTNELKEKSLKQLNEIQMLYDQSQVEVGRLTQKNSNVKEQLKLLKGQFDSIPREDILATYDSALDAQQRLFVMRGQLEKLEKDKKHLTEFLNYLEIVEESYVSGTPGKLPEKADGSSSSVEGIIQAQEGERQRLAKQMHDGPAQALSNFILQTEIALRLFDVDQNKARGELNNLKGAATTTFQKVRDFIFELRPMMLDDLGLVPTLKRYVESTGVQNDLDVRFTVTGVERRIESYIEVFIFRSIQEMLGNTLRYSNANQIKVQLDMLDSGIRTTIEDNGQGFDPGKIGENQSKGLLTIQERVEMMGGDMTTDSVVGQGTRITYTIPVSEKSQSVFG